MLSVRQVAKALNVSQVTVLRHIASATRPLPAENVDGRFIIFESDFHAWRTDRPKQGWPKGKPRGSKKQDA